MRSHAELAALEGLSSERKPAVALVMGAVDGEVVEALARHSGEVVYVHVETPTFPPRDNVTVHTEEDGDSAAVRILDELAAAGRSADFILLSPGRDPDRVRRTMEVLLSPAATADTVIVVWDATNEAVRAGLRQLEPEAWPKVAEVDFDFVAGRMVREGPTPGELEGGLGILVTDAASGAVGRRAVDLRHFDTFELLLQARPGALAGLRRHDQLAELTGEIGEDQYKFMDPVAENEQLRAQLSQLEAEHAHLREVWARTMNSFSWRVTTPLRTAKTRLRRARV